MLESSIFIDQWRGKLIAVLIHLAITLLITAIIAALIFFYWFPDPFDQMVRGQELFWLVVTCDLVLGPLVSFVIFNSKKNHKQLFLDYSLIAFVQIGALIYGVSVVAESRPVFIIFVKDRLEVVTAAEIDLSDLKSGVEDRFSFLSWTGPRLASAEPPKTREERQELLLSGLAGKDAQLLPKYYREYQTQLSEIKNNARAIAELKKLKPEQEPIINAAISDLAGDEAKFRWLPVSHRYGFWTALISYESGHPLKYLPIDPY